MCLFQLPDNKDGDNAKLYAIAKFTKSDFHSRFPSINSDNIYCEFNGFSGSLQYWDQGKFIFLYLDIIDGQLFGYKQLSDEEYCKTILRQIKEAEEDYYSRNYTMLFMNIPKYMRIKEMLRLFDSEEPSSQLCDVFISVYKVCDYGFNDLDKQYVMNLFSYISDDKKLKHKQFCASLPETITVYRGQCSESSTYNDALSWTFDRTVAEWYAQRFTLKDAVCVSATYPKSKIIYAFDAHIDDNEHELLLNPQYLTDVTITPVTQKVTSPWNR